MKVKEKIIFLSILVLAGFLRFWQLGQTPPSPNWDEVSLGYNALSLYETGRDEYGQFLPLILRSYDDYKPALYTYLAVPAVQLFGLSAFAVRFPAALLGTLTVFFTFFLVKELFSSAEQKPSFIIHNSLSIPLLSSFLLAISPWHLQFSRVAFESNIGVFVNILVVLFFLKGLKRPLLLPLCAFLAGLNLYVYQAEKIFTPLLVLSLLLIYRRRLLAVKRSYLIASVAVGLLLTIPLIRLALTTPEIFLRAKGTSVAADQTPFLSKSAARLSRDSLSADYFGLVFDNRRFTYITALAGGYLSHFDFNWLFVNGDEARHHAPGMGLLYLWELPFLLIGIYQLVFSTLPRQSKLLVTAWLLIAPIPASFSSGAPHAVRTLRWLPLLPLLVAFGLVAAWPFFRRLSKPVRLTLAGLAALFFCFNSFYFLNQYFVQQNKLNSQVWQYGYEQAVAEVRTVENRYDRVIVSNQPHLDQSYMFFLFFLRYPPDRYQSSGGTVSGGFAEEHKGFGKYTFRPLKWDEEEKNGRTLFVGRPQDFPPEAKTLKTIYFLDGQPAVRLVEG